MTWFAALFKDWKKVRNWPDRVLAVLIEGSKIWRPGWAVDILAQTFDLEVDKNRWLFAL